MSSSVTPTAAQKKQFGFARVEFKEFSISQLKKYEELFVKYNTTGDGFIDLAQLKYMMEKLGSPQTHVALKSMIKEIDEDQDGLISYREFLLIFSKSKELNCEGLQTISGQCASVDVTEVGVTGAKGFFEAKAQATLSPADLDRAEREAKKKEAEEKKANKAKFLAKAAMFQNSGTE